MEKVTSWKDHVFAHKRQSGNGLFWHLYLWQVNLTFAVYGFSYPRMEIVTSDMSDDMLVLYVHCGLFGFSFATTRFPFMKQRNLDSTRITGFYIGKEGGSFSFYNDDMGHSRKWKGWNYYCDWQRLIKGRSILVEMPGHASTIEAESIARDGYPIEKVTFQVIRIKRVINFSRWWGDSLPAAWKVVSLDEEVLRVPGKGENEWDQEDEYGIDLYIGNGEVNTRLEAVQYTLRHVDDLRHKRG